MALALVLAFDGYGGRSVEGGSSEDSVAQENDTVYVNGVDDDDRATDLDGTGVSDTDDNGVDNNTAHPTWTTTPTALRTKIITARTWMTQMEGQEKPPPSVQNDDDDGQQQQQQQQPVLSDDDDSSSDDDDGGSDDDDD